MTTAISTNNPHPTATLPPAEGVAAATEFGNDAPATTVEFWFDPSCPWAWMTSRWVDEVAQHRNLDVTWNVMSLAVLNENNDVSEEYRAFFPRALRYTRLVAAVRALHGQEAVKPLYDALGTQIHPGGSTDPDLVIERALAALSLPSELAEVSRTDAHDATMRASHFEGINRVGQDVGTPVIAVNGVTFFGPVISPAPKGAQALTLWDGVVAAASYDGFFEIKRTRTVGPIFG